LNGIYHWRLRKSLLEAFIRVGIRVDSDLAQTVVAPMSTITLTGWFQSFRQERGKKVRDASRASAS